MTTSPQLTEMLAFAKSEIKKGNLQGGIQTYISVIQQDDFVLEAHEGLAAAYFALQYFDHAIIHFKRITHLNPRDARAYINLGAIYNKLERYKEAIDILRKAITKDTSSATAYYNLGIAYRGLKQYSLAVSAYREAVRIEPKMVDAFYNLGNAYRELGNQTMAIDSYERALKENPGFDKAKRALEQICGTTQAERASENPFGRLVEETKLHSQARRVIVRKMTPADRVEDRETLTKITKKLEKQTKTLHEYIQSTFIPCLQQLSRLVVDRKKVPSDWMDSQKLLIETKEQFIQLRKAVKRTGLELRGHEELMNTPDLEEIKSA